MLETPQAEAQWSKNNPLLNPAAAVSCFAEQETGAQEW